ncbi:hypothetical protein [Streptomyces sp. 11x1]|uniref:hypothetical protein n=1 Tax=Streptomyces sp. 11x1 TaxID=3038642 RepID=UPI00292CDE71|nr:hypothetical protein [Streptomyces sp. 11x1]WNZ11683.1 hypothetical protein P8T65_31780 [Streptomyces sp. 11x1]
MGSKYTKQYTKEFKRDAITLVASSGRAATEVTRGLCISSILDGRREGVVNRPWSGCCGRRRPGRAE